MLTKPSLALRIAIGKGVGFLIGLLGFLALPWLAPEADLFLRWGLLLWYATLGAIVGIFGVYTYHPWIKMPLPWWFLSPWVGGWLNFVLTLIAYDQLKAVMLPVFGADGFFSSPFWFVAEGAIVGLFIGWTATRYGGEGPETAGR